MLAWEQGQYLRKYDTKLALRRLSMLFILGSLSLKGFKLEPYPPWRSDLPMRIHMFAKGLS